MRRTLRVIGSLAGLVAVGVLLAGLIWVFSGQFGARGQPQVAQQPYPPPQTPTPGAYPPPKPTVPEPLPTFTPLPLTPTIPPVPTPLPTPVVTVVPTAEPPIIPVPPRQAEPYTVVFRDDHVIRAINSDRTNDGKIHQRNLYGENDDDYPTYPRGHTGDDWGIWVMKRDGSEQRALAVGRWPTFSPDGQHVAYVAGAGEDRSVWVVSVLGGEPQRIAGGATGRVFWPAGDTLLYATAEGLRAVGLTPAGAPAGEPELRVPLAGLVEEDPGWVQWSVAPDGGAVLVGTPAHWWLVRLESDAERVAGR